MLDTGCSSGSVLTVTAGAGYGKSTLLAGWARTVRGKPVAWVDCRVAARSPGGFWPAVRLAVEQALPDAAVAEAGAVAAPIPGVDWVFGLPVREHPLVLVLDGLHEVGDASTLESLDVLLAYLPDGLTPVLSSRGDPPLHLARLRAEGRVAELRAEDLALDEDEVVELMASRGISLDEPQRRRLAAVTRNWPVAVGLAAGALAAAGDPVEILDGLASDRRVTDYLGSEVFADLDADSRRVMIDVSTVERFCPVLAAELSGVADAAAVLAGVAGRTGLLSPSSVAPGWWELHPLARAYLGAELAAGGRQRTRELHARAARWFLEQEMVAPALEHAIQARDQLLLEDVVEHLGVEPLLRSDGHAPSIAMLVARTDPSRFTSPGSLALAVALLASHDPRSAAALCMPLRGLRSAQPRVERMRAVAIARVGRTTNPGDGMHAALGGVRRDGATAAELLLLRAEEAMSPPAGTSLREMREATSAALAAATALGADRLALELRVTLGGIALILGESCEARRYADEVLRLGRRLDAELARPMAEARLLGTAAALDLGRTDVSRWTDRGPCSEMVFAGSVPWTLTAAAIDVSASHHRTADPRLPLHRLGRTLDGLDLALVDRGLVAAVIDIEVRLSGAIRDTHRLERAVARFPTCWAGSAEGAYLRAQALRLLRSDAAARRELRPVVHGPLEPVWPAMRLWVLALDGMLAHRCGAPATDSLAAALDLGSRTGRIGPFLAFGREMREALISCRAALRRHIAFVDDLLTRMDGPSPSPTEPLTSAEHTVLRRLDSMATLEEIATGLHVSRNTVKSHTAAIYRKLGVGSRRSALTRAQQLRLL